MNLSLNPAHWPAPRNGAFVFHPDTPDEVRSVLESAYSCKVRLRIFSGDVFTGQCWNEEWQTIGTIGRSTGQSPIPLMIVNARSSGGAAISANCIVAIQDGPGRFLYQHPLFHTGLWSMGPASDPGYAVSVLHNGKPRAQFKRADQAEPYIAFMKGERWSKAPPAKAPQADLTLPPAYFRREPTTDKTTIRNFPATRQQDIVSYRDESCTQQLFRWAWFENGKPRRNDVKVSFRDDSHFYAGYKPHRIVWLPDLKKRTALAMKAAA